MGKVDCSTPEKIYINLLKNKKGHILEIDIVYPEEL